MFEGEMIISIYQNAKYSAILSVSKTCNAGASFDRIFGRKERLKGRHPEMHPNPTVGKPTRS